MNKVDTEYFRIVNDILANGKVKKNRTGIDTIGIFGAQAKYNVDLNAFPILTTKKVHFPAIVHELLWFISGDTNIKYLVDNNVRIWNEWCYKRYKDTFGINHTDLCKQPNCGPSEPSSQDEFIQKIKEDVELAKKWGELGEGTYGGMWRAFPYYKIVNKDDPADYYNSNIDQGLNIDTVDQLQKVIEKLKFYPDDRRMIVSAWHPHWVDHCALPPCHCLFQFHTEELTWHERLEIAQKKDSKNENMYYKYSDEDFDRADIPKRRLNCLLYQRSVDTALGKPFNIASYALLTAMIAQTVNMVPGMFTHSMGDLHLYIPHLDGIKEQLKREPKQLPKVWLNPEVKSLFDFKYDDIKLIGYESHPAIKFDVAV